MKTLSRSVKLFAALSLILVVCFKALPAHADYNHNDIMTDNVFDDYGSMGAAQIDAFLNGFPNSCLSTNNGFNSPDVTGYSPSTGYTYGGNVSAGNVIYHAAQAYHLNPKVILATLEKESSVVTGNASYHCQYINTSMGYDCPDSGSCPQNPATESGFSKQVIHATWMLRFHEERSEGNIGWQQSGPGWDNSDDPQSCYSGRMTQGTRQLCPSGSSNYYDGWYTIDGAATHMDSGATAALYDYTPHFSGNLHFVNIYQGWFGATVLVTPLIYAPAVVSQVPGKINIFARGQDVRLWQNWYDNGNWQINWNSPDGSSPTSSAPSAISWGNGHMDVFETRNGVVWHDWYMADATGWRGEQPIGSPSSIWLGGSIATVAQTSGKINVFARGNDGRLWQTWYDNGNWQSWNYIDGPSPSSSSPTAISWGNGHMDVFETRNGVVWHDWYMADSTGWRGWQPIGSPNGVSLTQSLGVVAQTSGKINVFARGNDGRLWQTWYDNGNWQSWNYIDGPSPSSSSPTAISWGNGHMDVFETRNGVVWHDWYMADSTGWRGWQPIGRP